MRVVMTTKEFSPLEPIQSDSRAHAVICLTGIQDISGGRATVAWSWPLSSIQHRDQEWVRLLPPRPPYAFMTYIGTTLPLKPKYLWTIPVWIEFIKQVDMPLVWLWSRKLEATQWKKRVAMWRVGVTIVATETKRCVLCGVWDTCHCQP